MVGFLNAHGTPLNFDGRVLDLTFALDEDDALEQGLVWASEDLPGPTNPNFEDDFLDTLNLQRQTVDDLGAISDFDWEDPQLLWDEADIAAWVLSRYEAIIQKLEDYGQSKVIQFDDFIPKHSSSHESPRRLTWDELERKWNRRWQNRNAQKKAKWRIDGKRPHRDVRDGNVLRDFLKVVRPLSPDGITVGLLPEWAEEIWFESSWSDQFDPDEVEEEYMFDLDAFWMDIAV